MSYLQTQTIVTNYNDFKPANLSSTKLEENERSNGQLIGYPRYKDNGVDKKLELQLSWVQLLAYGIPLLNDKTKHFFPTESSRAHLRFPFNGNTDEEKEVEAKFRELDKILGGEEKKKEFLGNKSKKYEYTPIVRDPQSNADDEDEPPVKKDMDKPPPYKPAYAKFKLDLEWPDNKVKTKVFESLLDPETGKRTRTKVDVESIDDVASVVRYKSNVRCIVGPVKFWAHPSTKKDPQYGIVWKLLRVEVDKIPGMDVYKSTYESENFIDSDTEDELPKVETTKKMDTPKVSEVPTKDTVIEDDDDSDDSEEDEPVKDLKSPIVDVESSDDDEPVKDLKSTIVDVESSDDEEELPPPPPKSKKVVKAKK